MDFIHGLAVVLIFFEGIIIIQCKGAATDDKTSLNWIQDAPIIEISRDQQLLPNHLIEVIISKTDFETAQTSVRSRIVNATNFIMSRILRDRIILITPDHFDGTTREFDEEGDLFLRFGSYRGLVSFFDKFGDQIKKIEICYAAASSLRSQINRNIINRCANNLEELRIWTYNDDEIWEEMSSGDNGIIFPQVKKFHYIGGSSRNEFKLNLIFPKLESFKLFGSVNDINCLANVTTLKELRLSTHSIQGHHLEHIFANNRNMTMISLTQPGREETMHAIAENLTKLETLEVRFPAGSFLFRSNNRRLYKLSSMTQFNIFFSVINELIGDLSFDMPHLKKLSLSGSHIDGRIIDFINYFKGLEIVELLVDDYNPVECIEKLKHIKEFTANNFENSQLYYLGNFFEHFDEESKLQTLKLWLAKNDSYQTYEDTMKGFNIRQQDSGKSTWELSQGEQHGTGQKYLLFKRER